MQKVPHRGSGWRPPWRRIRRRRSPTLALRWRSGVKPPPIFPSASVIWPDSGICCALRPGTCRLDLPRESADRRAEGSPGACRGAHLAGVAVGPDVADERLDQRPAQRRGDAGTQRRRHAGRGEPCRSDRRGDRRRAAPDGRGGVGVAVVGGGGLDAETHPATRVDGRRGGVEQRLARRRCSPGRRPDPRRRVRTARLRPTGTSRGNRRRRRSRRPRRRRSYRLPPTQSGPP